MINPDFNAVETHIQDWLSTDQVPGMALAGSHENSNVFEYYGGASNLELETPVSIDTVFEIASVAKQFCALAILQLVQGGQLKLIDGIKDYFVDKSKNWDEITIEHLLTHTSGILNYYALPEERIPTIETVEESIKYLNSLLLEFRPGEKWSYSNTGYMMLAKIVTQVSGLPYEEYIKKNIFQPLGMITTQINDFSEIVGGRAAGYVQEDGIWKNRIDYPSYRLPPGAGGMLSSMADLLKWGNALCDGKLIDEVLYQQLWRPYILRDGRAAVTMFLESQYGYGWCLNEQAGVNIYWTPGATSGYTSTFVFLPEPKISVIGICNGSKLPDFNWFNQFVFGFVEKIMG